MNIPKRLIGKYVEIVWRDPVTCTVKSFVPDLSDIPSPDKFLAMQKERGVLGAVENGVVRIDHTMGTDSVLTPNPSTDIQMTCVQEAVIESCTVMVPEVGAS